MHLTAESRIKTIITLTGARKKNDFFILISSAEENQELVIKNGKLLTKIVIFGRKKQLSCRLGGTGRHASLRC